MAEPTGVTNSPPSSNSSSAPARSGGANKKRQRLYLYGGLAIGGFLLLSHRGGGGGSGSTSATDPNAQLQAASDAAAAQSAADFQPPGGGFPVDTGGGSYTYQGPSATTAPGVTVNVAPSTPGAPPAPPHPGRRPPGHPPHPGPKPGRKPPKRKPPVSNGRPPKPKQGHGTKPHPADNHGKHPDTHQKTPHGRRKKSPADVESVRGIGAGAMVMGREFPGAVAHRMGPPRINGDGTVTRSVTVDYGGHSATHLVHNNGERWTDNAPGASPPSRGVPQVNDGVPV